jgi:hypothetical protein|tara:strand:+ start:406 stop:744 length:339 start_codon:yes stop_codon:yes gene_type:complete
MLINIFSIIGIIVWAITAVMFAATLGAMFVPDKEKITSRIIISSLLLLPSIAIIPLSFAACLIIIAIFFIVGVSVFGIRITLELLVDGIPEVDEDGNIVEKTPEVKPTAPWV